MAFARGKRSLAISDRSGMQFPYVEMKREWNGSFVHYSEYEPKQPQLDPRHHKADPQGLKNARSDTVPGGGLLLDLDLQFWPGQFTSIGMQPGISGDVINSKRSAYSSVGNVTIIIT